MSPQYRKLRSLDTFVIHGKSLRWLHEEAEKLRDNQQQFVIVTHHAPSKLSIPVHYSNDLLSAAYASDLNEFIEESGATLWIHGHVHSQYDYVIGKTRIISNSRGYPDERNKNFIPDLTIEI